MGALVADKPVLKTPFLSALEAIGNSASKAQLLQIKQVLETNIPLIDVFGSLLPAQKDVPEEEIQHVAKDWFHEKTGWWIQWLPEKVMREGIIHSIDLAIQYGQKGRSGKPLPCDYWWVRNTSEFRFVSLISKQQQTILVMTPAVPRARPQKTRAKTKKTKSTR